MPGMLKKIKPTYLYILSGISIGGAISFKSDLGVLYPIFLIVGGCLLVFAIAIYLKNG
jgi:hypothetical protein